MTPVQPEPLWQIVVGDKEPWRRGRLFLISFGVLTALTDIGLSSLLILGGYLEVFFFFAAFRVFFWLQFYFIWVGVHGVRWLQGTISTIFGFCFFVWSFGIPSGAMMVWGAFSIATGVYLGFAPAVHFFAKRQQERRNWKESLVIAAVFALLLLTLSAGAFALFRYRQSMQQAAEGFADTAFERIFAHHDTYFLLDTVTDRLLKPPYGRAYLTKFLQDATIHAGDVHDIRRARGMVMLRYAFPLSLFAEGEMLTEGVGSKGTILLRIRLGGTTERWKIDQVNWVFASSSPQTRNQSR